MKQEDYKNHGATIIEKDAQGNPTLWAFELPHENEYINVMMNPHVAMMGNIDLAARLKIDYTTLTYVSDKTELELNTKKPVIMCGDLNVAHNEIDLKNPKTNRKNAGFTDEERAKMTELLNAGFVDTYRYKYPEVEGKYSWWSYMFHAREKNAGWRIDYFIVSESLKDKIDDAKILDHIYGSDHCPVELDLNI